jgi:hypothetical protein
MDLWFTELKQSAPTVLDNTGKSCFARLFRFGSDEVSIVLDPQLWVDQYLVGFANIKEEFGIFGVGGSIRV